MTKKPEDNLKTIAEGLVKEYKTKEAKFGSDGALKRLMGKTLEACLEGEMSANLGYDKYSRDGESDYRSRGSRNRST